MGQLESRSGLAGAFTDLFIVGAALKTAPTLGNTDTLRSRLLEMFMEGDRKAHTLGCPQDVLRQAKFAVAAYLDEMVMASNSPEKLRWTSKTLQYEMFETQVAGKEFFRYLDEIRRKLPLNTDLLEVYYMCLVLGFQGQYKLGGREKLRALVAEIEGELQVKQGELPPLAPHGKRPAESLQFRKRSMLPWVVSGVAVGIALTVFLILTFIASSAANRLAHKLHGLTEQVSEGSP